MTANEARDNFLKNMSELTKKTIEKIDGIIQEESKQTCSGWIDINDLGCGSELLDKVIVPYYKKLGFAASHGSGSFGKGYYLFLEW